MQITQVSQRLLNAARLAAKAAGSTWKQATNAADTARLEFNRRQRRRAAESNLSQRPIFLFVAPEAGLTPFYMGHVILARFVREQGFEPLMLSCGGIQPICSVKAAMRLRPTTTGDVSNAACVRCLEARRRVGQDNLLPDISIESLLSEDDRARISQLMTEQNASPWLLCHDDIAFGTACLGETLRTVRKPNEYALDESDKELLRAFLLSSLAVYFAVQNLRKQFKVGRIFYFGDYAFNIGPQVIANRFNIPITLISYLYNGDIDLRKIGLYPGILVSSVIAAARRWVTHSHRALGAKTIKEIFDGTLYRWRNPGGISVFSPRYSAGSRDICAELGLRDDAKTIVAYTSSLDEWICTARFVEVLGSELDNDDTPFASQDEWLQSLLTWFAGRPDLQLIIRLHPRMGNNFRFAGTSDQVRELKTRFQSLPGNVRIVWPESDISSYDLAEIADLVLVAWSSIGIELARFGAPVLAAFPNLGGFPREGVVGFGQNHAQYFSVLQEMLTRPLRLESIRNAYRWTFLLYWSFTVDISDVVPARDFSEIPSYRTPLNSALLKSVLIDGQKIDDLSMARLPMGKRADCEERKCHIDCLETLLVLLITGQPPSTQPGFCIVESHTYDGEGTKPCLILKGSNVFEFRDVQRTVERRSPLVYRLGRLLLEHRLGLQNNA